MRISRSDSTLPQVTRGRQVAIIIDGRAAVAFEGETIAAVLLAQGLRVFRHSSKTEEGRGIFCGMGICYDCLVTADGMPNVRACMTPVTPGMAIETHSG